MELKIYSIYSVLYGIKNLTQHRMELKIYSVLYGIKNLGIFHHYQLQVLVIDNYD